MLYLERTPILPPKLTYEHLNKRKISRLLYSMIKKIMGIHTRFFYTSDHDHHFLNSFIDWDMSSSRGCTSRWLCQYDKDDASTSYFQEQISQPLCAHTWMLLVLTISCLVYLMWMLAIVIFIIYIVNYRCSLKCIEKSKFTTIILAVANWCF